jgi:hypothetical protein
LVRDGQVCPDIPSTSGAPGPWTRQTGISLTADDIDATHACRFGRPSDCGGRPQVEALGLSAVVDD